MAAVASQVPTCFLSGITSDNNFQPLNDCGVENPFFYHQFYDDFDLTLKTPANSYTVTATGTGASVAGANGAGGLLLFTGGTTAGTQAIQPGTATVASYAVNIAPKKVFFLTRLSAPTATLTDANNTIFAGLMNPTPSSRTDGVYFLYSNGVLTINSTIASTVTSATIPAAAFATAIVNNSFFDLGFFINRNGEVMAYVDTQLVGYIPQSNLGTSGNPQNAGPTARLTPASFTTAILAPTIGMTNTSTVARTMTADFFGAFAER